MNLYQVLSISKSASQAEIKAAYKKACQKHHPDKGGDPEEFAKIAKAYEVLRSPMLRKQYDASGEIPEDSPSSASKYDSMFAAIVMEGFQKARVTSSDFHSTAFMSLNGYEPTTSMAKKWLEESKAITKTQIRRLKENRKQAGNDLHSCRGLLGNIEVDGDRKSTIFNHILQDSIKRADDYLAKSLEELVLLEQVLETLQGCRDLTDIQEALPELSSSPESSD